MSKYIEKETQPFVTNIGGKPTTVKIEQTVYKIEEEKDIDELVKKFDEGVRIITQINIKGIAYVVLEKVVPTQIQVAKGMLKK